MRGGPVNWSANVAAELCLFFAFAIVAVATYRVLRSRASARRWRAFESPDGHYRRSYARTYANQYTPRDKDALIRSPSSD
jgi:hypothetical protein